LRGAFENANPLFVKDFPVGLFLSLRFFVPRFFVPRFPPAPSPPRGVKGRLNTQFGFFGPERGVDSEGCDAGLFASIGKRCGRSEWMGAWGEADFVITHPEGYELSAEFTKGASITHNQDNALKDADFVYVKNWSSYEQYGKVLCSDAHWMMNNKKLALTNNAKLMHCLPVRRNVELSDEILDGPNSIVTKEASNRVWAAQAVLAEILKSK